mgnify:CR=1 FL=1
MARLISDFKTATISTEEQDLLKEFESQIGARLTKQTLVQPTTFNISKIG